METVLSSYPSTFFQELSDRLAYLKGIVAGSSALAGYLKQEGIEPGFQPNDIDIFVPGRIQHVVDWRGCLVAGQYEIRSLKSMKELLTRYGFTENNKFGAADDVTSDSYYGSLNKIQKVVSFNNLTGQEIQVIVVDTSNLIEHISKDFDLSACVSWLDPRTNSYKTLDPDATKRKEMYPIRAADTPELEEKSKQRAQKYISRGFRLIEKPCPCAMRCDKREELSDKKFDSIEVTDIFTLEEMPIREYLQKSNWNIVLKAGEQYYAFGRKALIDYMKTKRTCVNSYILDVYDTPLNQSITAEGFVQLKWADYSIYELKSAYSVNMGRGKVKSLYHLNCYSVKQWVDGEISRACNIPAKKADPPVPVAAPVLEIGIDDILAAHAHLMEPGNLEAFHAAWHEINGH